MTNPEPFKPAAWLGSSLAALDRATLAAKLAGQTFSTVSEWEDAREYARAADDEIASLLIVAHARLLAAEKLAGAHVDTRGA